MNETKKLYDLDAYQEEFEAIVLSCEAIKDDTTKAYALILDQTLFFPEEGGQSCDKGTINEAMVLDVQIKNQVITHTVSTFFMPGDHVHGKIDRTHRFNNMQQHSGEHILSGLIHEKFGYDNVGFHLSDQIVTMDFNGVITKEELEQLETKANQVIVSNLPIQVSYPEKETLKTMDYRSKIEIEGAVRIVTIPGVDVCACCAPHVARTGEVGLLKVMNLQNYKGGVRISILCGFRALEAFRQKNEVFAAISALLSANQDSVLEAVTRLKESNQALSYECLSIKQARLQDKIAQIPNTQENVLVFQEGLDMIVMRDAVNHLCTQHPGLCGVLNKKDEKEYQFVFSSKTIDVQGVLTQLKQSLAVRGGGSKVMVQGSILETLETIEDALSKIGYDYER